MSGFKKEKNKMTFSSSTPTATAGSTTNQSNTTPLPLPPTPTQAILPSTSLPSNEGPTTTATNTTTSTTTTTPSSLPSSSSSSSSSSSLFIPYLIPDAFALVEPGIYRSSLLLPVHLPYIQTLHLKTIIQLSPETLEKPVQVFLETHRIQLVRRNTT
ncbi:hypothetical protein HMI56_007388 [Coelomomyces lativittatus]|nr:hypothetical protein HMI56_007388 [Coelomomyces lativittatus]